MIDTAYQILEEIQPATVRAVCYRLFTLGLIGAMSKNETNRVSSQLTDAREQGLIPWQWIVDETREAERIAQWSDPEDYADTVQAAYRRDRWADQPDWIEVWSEKGTVRGTLAPILQTYGVTFRVMHGYGSATALHQIADETARAGHLLTAFYVGDYDPSGLHMSEVDLPGRLANYGAQVSIERIALTDADTQSGLPSFPATSKNGDKRYQWYVGRLLAGHIDGLPRTARSRWIERLQCWELDALSPVVLRHRVEAAIVARLDQDAWKRAEVIEAAERESLMTILSAWRDSISRQA